MNTGKIIADLRNKKGWSQADLADKSEVSRVMIGKYELGEAVPSIDMELLEEEKKKILYDLIDTYIRNTKARRMLNKKVII